MGTTTGSKWAHRLYVIVFLFTKSIWSKYYPTDSLKEELYVVIIA